MIYLDEPLSFVLYVQTKWKGERCSISYDPIAMCVKAQLYSFLVKFSKEKNDKDKVAWFWYWVCACKSVSWLSITFQKRLSSVVHAVMHGIGFPVALKNYFLTALNSQSSLEIALVWSTLTKVLPHSWEGAGSLTPMTGQSEGIKSKPLHLNWGQFRRSIPTPELPVKLVEELETTMSNLTFFPSLPQFIDPGICP